MKKSILLLLLPIVFIGCNQQKPYKIKIVNDSTIYAPSGNLRRTADTLSDKAEDYVYTRYFLVSYQSMLKDDHNPITGNLWFSASGFPTKREIDSMVYNGFAKKKSCYQSVIVLNIFEFKNIEDYIAYTDNYSGDKHSKKKESCCTDCPTKLQLQIDTSIQIQQTKFY